jgi:hypothetical protein
MRRKKRKLTPPKRRSAAARALRNFRGGAFADKRRRKPRYPGTYDADTDT